MIWDICPDTEQLQRLLNEQLDPAREAELSGHIEQCEHCHQELERQTLGRAPSPASPARPSRLGLPARRRPSPGSRRFRGFAQAGWRSRRRPGRAWRGSPDPAVSGHVRRGSPDPAVSGHVRRGSPDPAVSGDRRSQSHGCCAQAGDLRSQLRRGQETRAERVGGTPAQRRRQPQGRRNRVGTTSFVGLSPQRGRQRNVSRTIPGLRSDTARPAFSAGPFGGGRSSSVGSAILGLTPPG
jgi:hypothetical protein